MFLYEPLAGLDSYKRLCADIEKRRTPVLVSGALESQKIHLACALMNKFKRPGLFITHSELKAKEIYDDLKFFLKDKARYYPAKDIIFYAADVRSGEISKERFIALDSLIENSGGGHQPDNTLCLSVEALFDRLSPPEIFKASVIKLNIGDIIPPDRLIEKLLGAGYERRPAVEGSGQFSLRGGILDIWCVTYDNAARIEFWDDEIDSIRLLDAFCQRSIEKIESLKIFPRSELVYDSERYAAAIDNIDEAYRKDYANRSRNGLFKEAASLKENMTELLDNMRSGNIGNVKNLESFSQFFYQEKYTLLDYIPKDALIFFDEPNRVSQHADNVLKEFGESITGRIQKGSLLSAQAEMVVDYQWLLHNMQTSKRDIVLLNNLMSSASDFGTVNSISFETRSSGTVQRRFDILVEDLRNWRKEGYKVVLLSGSRTRGIRLADELNQNDIPSMFKDETLTNDNHDTAQTLTESSEKGIISGEIKINDPVDVTLKEGVVTLLKGSLHKGFIYPQIKFAFVSDVELFNSDKNRKRRNRFGGKDMKTTKINSFSDLRTGDYIVHLNHGIGIFKGIEQIATDGTFRDYIKLEYADRGALYLHANQMNMVQKYIGGEGVTLKLNKLGGGDWSRTLGKARKAIEIMAKDLVELYARRQQAKGFIYDDDNGWQREFEELFPFEETEDQLDAIEDVKHDMESEKIMDRLVCGDVGYGKTEIAIRAAFKAVQSGKQVAYLVPTTILAQQHYTNFDKRMSPFAVGVNMLSRFKSQKQQKDIIKQLGEGKLDIVIGTHRLLSKDITFKNLGLVIIDEEQRFGVSHKEKLKRLTENVDVMTLTATPIPRTLHMSLTGLRDLSILEEPPQERQPIQTYVMEYSPEFVKDAINRELARNGQVYYLHNRVNNIADAASKVQALCPEANIGYAHGQMPEQELENIMIDFIEGNIDVLVCTTIIETGLDIPNVNTIIINDADYMGLAQLYQLRGRVGRASRLAYAYLMYRKDKVIQEKAEKRLQTIKDFTEFGSGFRIAMRDLEIRGAGNLLGAEQHGHMDTVGYELYCKLLDEAVKTLRGEVVEEEFETLVDLKISAYIPEGYIENEEQKLDIYKKISRISSMDDFNYVQEEIEDRFGNPPNCVNDLLRVALLKAEANRLGILSITQRNTQVIFTFKADAKVDTDKLFKMIQSYKNRVLFTQSTTPYITYKLSEIVNSRDKSLKRPDRLSEAPAAAAPDRIDIQQLRELLSQLN